VIIITKELAAFLKEIGNGTSSLIGLGSSLEPS
jgi:succinyl-CoA synthetase alpha subunit